MFVMSATKIMAKIKMLGIAVAKFHTILAMQCMHDLGYDPFAHGLASMAHDFASLTMIMAMIMGQGGNVVAMIVHATLSYDLGDVFARLVHDHGHVSMANTCVIESSFQIG